MHVNDVGTVPAQQGGQLSVRLATPDHPGGQQRLLRRRPVLDLVAVLLETPDLVPGAREFLALLVHDAVLATRHSRAIPAMDYQHPHARLLPAHRASTRTPATLARRAIRGPL